MARTCWSSSKQDSMVARADLSAVLTGAASPGPNPGRYDSRRSTIAFKYRPSLNCRLTGWS